MKQTEYIALIERNRNLIVKISRIYARNAENRKDLQQEILLQAWKSSSRFDGRVKFSTWLYRVALNTALAFNRKEGRYLTKELDDIPADIDSENEPNRWNRVEVEINQLESPNREILLLHLEGCRNPEIAEVLGLSESNVSTRLSRVRIRLKEKLNPSKH